MKVVDNTAFILHRIEDEKNKQVAELDKEFASQIADFKKELDETTQAQIEEITLKKQLNIERIEQQQDSLFALKSKQMVLEKQQQVTQKIVEEIITMANKSSPESKKVVESLLKRAKKAGKAKSIAVPKWFKKAGTKATLKECGVEAVINNQETFEVNIRDLIKENEAQIHAYLMENVFP